MALSRSMIQFSTQDVDRNLHELFDAGEFSVCLCLIGDGATDEQFILGLRCLVRLGHWAEAVRPDNLQRVWDLVGPTAFRGNTLLATAFFRSDMQVPAETYFRKAYSLADSDGVTEDDRAELHYYDALRNWARDPERSLALLELVFENEKWNAWAIQLRAWIASVSGDLRLQMMLLREALAAATETWLRAQILHALSHLVKEFFDASVAGEVLRAANALRWTGDTIVHEFHTYRSLAWCAALAGEPMCAGGLFERAKGLAAFMPGLRVLVLADRAYIAHGIGNNATAKENAMAAFSLAETVNFGGPDEDRIALPLLVTMFSKLGDVASAEHMWAKYTSLRSRISPLLSYGNGDQRMHAHDRAAEGWLELARGNHPLARRYFTEAFSIFDGIGYTWRAVELAMILGQVTSTGYLLDYAAIKAEQFPEAWFVQSLKERSRDWQPLSNVALSATKRNVIAALVAGKATPVIARELTLSKNTIRNVIVELFDLCGLETPRTRFQLVQALKDRGLS